MLEAVASQKSGKVREQFVLSFDGKLLRSGLTRDHGDIDMSGIEQKPTFTERRERFENDLEIVSDLQIEALIPNSKEEVNNLEDTMKLSLVEKMQNSAQVLTLRIKDARQAKLNKEFNITSMINSVGGDSKWRGSKMVNAIFPAKCELSQINEFIEKALNQNQHTCLIARFMYQLGE